jgi:GT2 family glycosyltransferase
VGGRVCTPGFVGRVRPDAGFIRWYGQHIGNVAALELSKPRQVKAVMECNWAWRSSVLRSLDFDNALDHDDASMYGLDLCLQAQELGYAVVYEPRARVIHHAAPRDPRLDRGDRPHRSQSYARNYTYIGLKHFHGLRRVVFRIWWWVIGERGAYAATTAFVDICLQRAHVREQWKAAMRGRREGTLLWRQR